ncbi:NucA/NucB deoxyribonuclease domain-containing protein [Bradyrhizobium sp. B124]|uniref:NucA/NucB deoxyribonuclease domain-containing protein n=1 Tax=Bradyrhizobium sp. B124 TaxID=3140245 RepID=UPI003182E02A
MPLVGVPAATSGKSFDPDFVSRDVANQIDVQKLTASPISPPSGSTYDWRTSYRPLGELKAATYTPTQRIGYLAANALMGLGMKPYTANDLTSRVGNVLGLTPLGVVGSALDLIDAKRRDDLPGAIAAAAGMIPGAKKLGAKAGNIAKEITLSRSVHGEAAEHAADAINAGHPSVLTIDRPGKDTNSWLATGKPDKVAGKHLDEYPPAMFREGGFGASVRPINPSHNTSAGARVGNLCRGLPDGAQIKIIVGD